MKGTINITVDELEEQYSIGINCKLMDADLEGRIAIIHSLMDILEFDRREEHALALCIVTGNWPDQTTEKIEVNDPRRKEN